MVKPIMKDIFFLEEASLDATSEDLSVADDLMDTFNGNVDWKTADGKKLKDI